MPFSREPLAGLRLAAAGIVLPLLLAASPVVAQSTSLPPHLADRGPGLTTSLFGTYVEKGELLVYAFYEYTKTGFFEYQPRELGYSGGKDFRGKLVEREALLFFGYGISDRLAIELEGSLHTTATFDRAAGDQSGVPARIEESGLGDVEVQLTWRWQAEAASHPELFSFAKVVFPFQKDKVLVGTSAWEGEVGLGVVRGFRWGTLTGRATVAYDGEDGRIELGEYGVDYLKRLSPRWRMVASIEGEAEDIALIGEAQWFFSQRNLLKLNCGFGLTEKAPDIAPEVGVLFRF